MERDPNTAWGKVRRCYERAVSNRPPEAQERSPGKSTNTVRAGLRWDRPSIWGMAHGLVLVILCAEMGGAWSRVWKGGITEETRLGCSCDLLCSSL